MEQNNSMELSGYPFNDTYHKDGPKIQKNAKTVVMLRFSGFFHEDVNMLPSRKTGALAHPRPHCIQRPENPYNYGYVGNNFFDR